MKTDFDAELKYVKVAQHLREQVLSGALQPGERLASFPEMKARGVGQNTLERAHRILEHEGLIERKRGLGVFVAQAAKQTRKGVIGVLGTVHAAPTPYGSHFYNLHLLEGIQAAAETENAQVLLLSSAPQQQDLEGVDGVITLATSLHDWKDIASRLPLVSTLDFQNSMPSVCADDAGGARLAVKHCLDMGHRRIAFLSMMRDVWSRQRLDGYREALASAGVTPDPLWVRPLYRDQPAEGRFSFHDSGHDRMVEWLADNWKRLGCTALLAHNDQTAIGVIDALQEAGLQVPEDVSVVGFDGTEICNYVSPKLTSIEVPLFDIGQRAAQLLLQLIRNDNLGSGDVAPQTETLTEVLPTTLQVRQSTAQPRVLPRQRKSGVNSG